MPSALNTISNALKKVLSRRPLKSGIFPKVEESLSPNVRAIRLAISVADVLLALGVSVSDVVSMALDITERYCKRRVSFDVSYTIIMASQDRGNEREPLTMLRHSTQRTPNNMLMQAVQELVREIRDEGLDLDAAEEKFDAILNDPPRYPYWLTMIGNGSIAAGVAVMYGARTEIIVTVFLVGAIVSYILRVLSHNRIPTFFAQVGSAVFITLVAALMAWLAAQPGFAWLEGIDPNLIVIGGIVMLVAGLTIVSAVQDAIDEYYMTANARLLRVTMMTAGIVAGVMIGLYLTKQFGIAIAVEPEGPRIGRGDWQLTGAVIIAAGYALSMQSKYTSILLSGGLGALAWFIYTVTETNSGLSSVIGSGVAATAVGLIGTSLSRVIRTPSTALIMAGIVPLVPGLTLYLGLLQIIDDSSNYGSLDQGIYTMFIALLIALAIASGAAFGNLVGRPIRRSLVLARNAMPRWRLSKKRR
jgi:uncharacterized membrane protein YjjP (DUF1212 family)